MTMKWVAKSNGRLCEFALGLALLSSFIAHTVVAATSEHVLFEDVVQEGDAWHWRQGGEVIPLNAKSESDHIELVTHDGTHQFRRYNNHLRTHLYANVWHLQPRNGGWSDRFMLEISLGEVLVFEGKPESCHLPTFRTQQDNVLAYLGSAHSDPVLMLRSTRSRQESISDDDGMFVDAMLFIARKEHEHMVLVPGRYVDEEHDEDQQGEWEDESDEEIGLTCGPFWLSLHRINEGDLRKQAVFFELAELPGIRWAADIQEFYKNERGVDALGLLEWAAGAISPSHPSLTRTAMHWMAKDYPRPSQRKRRFGYWLEDAFNSHLEFSKKILGDARSPENLELRMKFIWWLQGQDRYLQAETLLRYLVADQKEILGPSHVDTLRLMETHAFTLNIMDRKADAEQIYKEILAIREREFGETATDTVHARENLEHLWSSMGRDTGEEIAEDAVDRMVMEGRYDDALATYRDMLAPHAEAEREAVELRISMISVLLKKQDTPAAQSMYEDLMKILSRSGYFCNEQNTFSLHSMFWELEYAGHYEMALAGFREVLGVLQSCAVVDNDVVLDVRRKIASILRSQERYAEAEIELNEILIKEKDIWGDFSIETLETREALIWTWMYQDKLDALEGGYSDTLTIYKNEYGTDHGRTRSVQSVLATVWCRLGRYEEALALESELLVVHEQRQGIFSQEARSGRDSLLNCAIRRAREIGWGADDFSGAVSTIIDSAFSNVQQQGWLLGNAARQRVLNRLPFDRNAVWTYAADRSNGESARLAMRESLLLKDILSDISGEIRRLASVSPDSGTRDLLDRYRANASEISSLSTSNDPDTTGRLRALNIQREGLEQQLGQALANQGRSRQQVTVEGLQQAIGSEVLIEYREYSDLLKGTPRLAAVVLGRDHLAHYALGDWEPIANLIQAYRKAIESRDQPLVDALADELYDKLWNPLAHNIPAGTTIYISPDDSLHLLPFSALRNPETGRYLIQNHPIQMLGASRDLLRQPLGNPPKQPVVAYAPHYSLGGAGTNDQASSSGSRTYDLARSGLHFDHLPGALTEGQAISALLADLEPQALSGAAATEAAIRSVSGPRFLHIATHGFYLGEDAPPVEQGSRFGQVEQLLFETDTRPDLHMTQAQVENPLLRSGLALAGANDGARGESDADDGVLTALEAQGLNLAGTELVVLSACDTGVGEVRTGQGVASLQRAFLEAGASSVVYSLWKVDDDATRRLMTSLYEGVLTESTLPLDRLRQVQLEMLASEIHAAPWYWAAFTGASMARQVAR